jgi:hypothetical protein
MRLSGFGSNYLPALHLGKRHEIAPIDLGASARRYDLEDQRFPADDSAIATTILLAVKKPFRDGLARTIQ